jgi:hypothetical protein
MSDDRRVDFENLNWLGKTVFIGGGKTVFIGGTALRLTANLLDKAADRASKIAEDSREAYRREVDPNIEDAKVIEERNDD